MGKITAITAQKKHKDRCNVFIDGEFRFGLSLETLMKNRFKVNDEVDEKALTELVNESEKVDALNKAVNLISKTLKTKRQIKEYLINKGYTEEIAWYVVDKLKEYNYIDDAEYSKRFTECTSKTQGKKLLEFKLMAKGVKKEDIEKGFNNAEVDMQANCNALCEKYMKNKENTKENIAKAYRYLVGRGFSYEEVSNALSKFRVDD